jgi:hypothetical protein
LVLSEFRESSASTLLTNDTLSKNEERYLFSCSSARVFPPPHLGRRYLTPQE